VKNAIDPIHRAGDRLSIGQFGFDKINLVADVSDVLEIPCRKIIEHSHLIAARE
jgi:hypothetical protein